jgi:alkylhydroperoxidase family enzyme
MALRQSRERSSFQFSDEELVNLTLAVVTINGWNRLNISLRTVPGSYEPKKFQEFLNQMAA